METIKQDMIDKMVKENLLKRFADAYQNDGFPPMAGKIMGLFYISNQKYLSFNDIIEETGASKGAVSKTIKLLIDMRRINFIPSKEKGRKRLFYLDIQGIKIFLRSVVENYRKQDQLLIECKGLRNDENDEMNNFIDDSLEFNKSVLSFVAKKTEQYFN